MEEEEFPRVAVTVAGTQAGARAVVSSLSCIIVRGPLGPESHISPFESPVLLVWYGRRCKILSDVDTSCVSTWSWSAIEAPFSVLEVVWWRIVMIAESGDEESNDGLICEDEVGFEWNVCRPVWVRSRSRKSFPVDYHHLSVDDCPIGDTSLPVWMVVMRPVVGNGTAYARIGLS